MMPSPLAVLCGEAISSLSMNLTENLALSFGKDGIFHHRAGSYADCETKTGGESSKLRIDESFFSQEQGRLNVQPRNLKFFDRASLALHHCFSPLAAACSAFDPSRLGLYIGVGPANAELDDFLLWSDENLKGQSELYTLLKASSVVRLLPNVVMANLSMCTGARGENTIYSGTHCATVGALQAALRSIRSGRCDAALVGGASFPQDYFNRDSFNRIRPLSGISSSLPENASGIMISSNFSREAEGFIIHAETWREPSGSSDLEVLSKDLYKSGAFCCCEYQPTLNVDFLAGSEPLGLMRTLSKLNASDSSGLGVSICRDWFGNCSALILGGRSWTSGQTAGIEKILSVFSERRGLDS